MTRDRSDRPAGAALALLALTMAGVAATKPVTVDDLLARAPASDWRAPDPESTLYLELATGRVVIELAPRVAPLHVANIRALARAHYFDGLAVVRVQDDYVVQWADPKHDRPLPAGVHEVAAEFDAAPPARALFQALPLRDVYADEVGVLDGFPAARDPQSGAVWLAHCYGMVGVGRDDPPESDGSEMYAVIGHSPRQLDRNVALVGRILSGVDRLSSLPRGTGVMGFYEGEERPIPIRAVRVAADVPAAERTDLEVLRTDSATFRSVLDQRRNRREPWFKHDPGRIELCNVPLPVRPRTPPPVHAGQPLAFTHVTVVDVEAGRELADRTVLVADSRITEVGRDGTVIVPAGATVVDARGKYLIPGLWDMHVHVAFGDWIPADPLVNLAPFVANGVTGVREMGGDLDVLLDWRRRIAAGQLLGPRMVVAGPMLDGPTPRFPSSAPVASAADGRRVVDELQSRGVDFIKIQSLIPREGYFAAAQESRRLGIPFVGHVPDAVRAAEASNAGQRSIEHFTGIFEGASSIEDRLVHGPKTLGEVVRTYDPARARAIVALMARNRTWQVPTLVWERGQWLIDDIDLSADPRVRYAPAAWRDRTWPMFKESILKDMDTDPLAVRRHYVQMELDMTRAMFRAGVPFMAGTDTAAGVHVFPGFSLHQELALFVQAGLSPLEALRTATLNPARFLGREADLGTVAPGKLADLVLLDADPLTDIRNAQRIAAVVLAGRYLPRGTIDDLLEQVAQAAAASK